MAAERAPRKLALGVHVGRDWAAAGAPLAAHLAAARAALPLGAAQVFVAGPRSRRLLRVDGLAGAAAAFGGPVFAHACYPAVPWTDAGAASVAAQLDACAAAGLVGLVVHLGAAADRVSLDAQLDAIARRVPRGHAATLYFENPASPGWPAAGGRALAAAAARLAAAGVTAGVCVDTAHLWTAGVDVGSRAGADAWLADFGDGLRDAAAAGSGLPVLLHLNDSERPRGAGPDAHADWLAGAMWGPHAADPARSGLAAFLEAAAANGWPAIVERPRESAAGAFAVVERLGF